MFVYLEGGHLQRGVIDELLGKSAMKESAASIRESGPLDYSQ